MKYARKYLDKKYLFPLFTGFLVFLCIKLFLVDTEIVRSPSMQPTLREGEWVLVKKIFTPHRDDIVIVSLPLSDKDESQEKAKVFKRLTGMPGDSVSIIDSKLYVNGKSHSLATTMLHNYVAKIARQADTVAFSEHRVTEKYLIDDSCVYLLIINNSVAAELKGEKRLISLVSNAEDPDLHDESIFPYDPSIKWNKDHFGPVYVPRAGEEIQLNANNVKVYERIIAGYEGNLVEMEKGRIYINEAECTTYKVKQNYYFVTGDNFDNSIDSRHWGFVPEKDLKGRLFFSRNVK